jgi:hypothetical protein
LSEFLPGFVHFQMSSQVRFYQIRVVFWRIEFQDHGLTAVSIQFMSF